MEMQFYFGTYIQLHFTRELSTDPIPETTLALTNVKPRRQGGDLALGAPWDTPGPAGEHGRMPVLPPERSMGGPPASRTPV